MIMEMVLMNTSKVGSDSSWVWIWWWSTHLREAVTPDGIAMVLINAPKGTVTPDGYGGSADKCIF